MCLDEEISIKGNYVTREGSTLMVVFEKCSERTSDKCKTEEEIEAWLEFKYILVFENNKAFSQRSFDNLSID